MGYTGLQTWDNYGRAMQASLASFSRVTERRFLEVDPATVTIVEVPRNMTFTEFNQRFPSTIEPAQLALINGVEEDAVLEAGSLMKRIVGGELPER